METKTQNIITKRLLLRSYRDEDQEDLIDIVKDPKVYQTYMLPDLHSKEEENLLFTKLKNLTLSDKHYTYGIFLNNQAIGFINDVSIDDDEIEVGYFLSSKEWNKGYATEALEALIKELFRVGFKKVIAGHFEGNTASGKVMQKCGMTLIDKKDIIVYRNKSHNCVYYEIKRV